MTRKHSVDNYADAIARLRNASGEEQERIIRRMNPHDALMFDADFEAWAHDAQLPPKDEGWRTWLMMAGRGFGKTRAGAEWIHRLATKRAGVRIALIGASIHETRRIMVEGISGLLTIARRHRRRVHWEPSLGRFRWCNGSEAQLFSGDHADGLRGPEHDFAWVLTFEIFGDDQPTTVGEILADVSAGRIATSDPSLVMGYAAMGKSAEAAVEPLVDNFGVDLFDDGKRLRSPEPNAPITIDYETLGSVAGARPAARFEREQTPIRELPTSLALSYYDPERDYQTGLARAAATGIDYNEVRTELPAVVNAADARAIAENRLARNWAQRDRMTVRLAPRYLGVTPGGVMRIGPSQTLWQLQRCSVDGMAIVVELRPAWRISPALAAEAGRSNPDADVAPGPVTLALFEVLNPDEVPLSGSLVYLAASSPSPGWKPASVDVTLAGASSTIRTARRKSVLGNALAVLAEGQAHLLDQINSVEVELIDESQWLTSCDDESLADGANAALLGDELIQFGEAIPLGAGTFRLARLLRGRLGTEWAMGTHTTGDPFVLIEPDAFQTIHAAATARGAEIRVTERTLAGGSGATAARIVTASALRPISPIGLHAEFNPAGDLIVSWTRRSRSGWAWLDEIDAPIGETKEEYSVTIEGVSGTLVRDCGSTTLTIPAAELIAAGSGPATIDVRQVGDWAASPPTAVSINLP